MKANEYQCAMCGKVYKKRWKEEEAWEEHDRNFPGEPHETAAVVCDDCYKAMVAVRPPPGMQTESFFPIGRYGKDENEIYGRSPGLEAINEYLQAVKEAQNKWIRLKINRPWWWHVLHPILSRKTKTWIAEFEAFLNTDEQRQKFEKIAAQAIIDGILYGGSRTKI